MGRSATTGSILRTPVSVQSCGHHPESQNEPLQQLHLPVVPYKYNQQKSGKKIFKNGLVNSVSSQWGPDKSTPPLLQKEQATSSMFVKLCVKPG